MSCIKHNLLLAAFVVGSQVALAQASADAARFRDGFDLRVADGPRVVLVELHHAAQGTVNLKQGATEIRHVINMKYGTRFVDEVGAPGGSAIHHRRTFLEAQKTENGRIQDPGLEGVCLLYSKVAEDVSVEAKAPRQILKSFMRREAELEAAVGLRVELPADVKVGESFELECDHLLATMLLIENRLSEFEATLRLVRVNGATQRAFLTGTAKFSANHDNNAVTTTGAYEGALTAEVDMAADVLVNLSFSGKSVINGRGKSEGKVTGDATFEASASSQLVASASARKVKKPVFRENTHVFAGVQFKLPSCWLAIPSPKPGMKMYIDSRSESGAAMEIAVSSEPADPSADEFIEGFLHAARKEAPDIKVKKATFPTGDGITFELTADTRDKVRGFVAPVGQGIVRVRLVGPADAVRKSDCELRALQDSLAEAE